MTMSFWKTVKNLVQIIQAIPTELKKIDLLTDKLSNIEKNLIYLDEQVGLNRAAIDKMAGLVEHGSSEISQNVVEQKELVNKCIANVSDIKNTLQPIGEIENKIFGINILSGKLDGNMDALKTSMLDNAECVKRIETEVATMDSAARLILLTSVMAETDKAIGNIEYD